MVIGFSAKDGTEQHGTTWIGKQNWREVQTRTEGGTAPTEPPRKEVQVKWIYPPGWSKDATEIPSKDPSKSAPRAPKEKRGRADQLDEEETDEESRAKIGKEEGSERALAESKETLPQE